jgi:hypothetical protein
MAVLGKAFQSQGVRLFHWANSVVTDKFDLEAGPRERFLVRRV